MSQVRQSSLCTQCEWELVWTCGLQGRYLSRLWAAEIKWRSNYLLRRKEKRQSCPLWRIDRGETVGGGGGGWSVVDVVSDENAVTEEIWYGGKNVYKKVYKGKCRNIQYVGEQSILMNTATLYQLLSLRIYLKCVLFCSIIDKLNNKPKPTMCQ